MNNSEIINSVTAEVKNKLLNEGSGHDWWHVYRVLKMAEKIHKKEGGDILIISLSALLHDISDWKFNDGDDTVGPKVAREILEKNKVPEEIIQQVETIIQEGSFKGAEVPTIPTSLEGKILQDADRLDAIGAIGIGRTFAYGGHKNKPFHDPEIKPTRHSSKEEYFKNNSSTINHFYEKLLLLKDLMNTVTAKELAQGRHKFMEEFLEEFYKEWEGRK